MDAGLFPPCARGALRVLAVDRVGAGGTVFAVPPFPELAIAAFERGLLGSRWLGFLTTTFGDSRSRAAFPDIQLYRASWTETGHVHGEPGAAGGAGAGREAAFRAGELALPAG